MSFTEFRIDFTIFQFCLPNTKYFRISMNLSTINCICAPFNEKEALLTGSSIHSVDVVVSPCNTGSGFFLQFT